MESEMGLVFEGGRHINIYTDAVIKLGEKLNDKSFAPTDDIKQEIYQKTKQIEKSSNDVEADVNILVDEIFKSHFQ